MSACIWLSLQYHLTRCSRITEKPRHAQYYWKKMLKLCVKDYRMLATWRHTTFSGKRVPKTEYLFNILWSHYITLHYIIKLFIVAKVKNCKVHYGASHTTMSGYDCRNKCVFSFRRNDNSDVAVVTSRGRVFQITKASRVFWLWQNNNYD